MRIDIIKIGNVFIYEYIPCFCFYNYFAYALLWFGGSSPPFGI